MPVLNTRTWGVALALAGLVAGCGSHSTGRAVVKAGDPGYALHQLAVARQSSTAAENEPTSLRKALPNYRYELGSTGRTVSFSDAVVVGSVARVEKGNGVIWRDDSDFTVVDYDDARADTRSAYVTMTVDRGLESIASATGTVTFRVVAPFQADPEEFVEGLAGLKRIAVVLTRDPDATASTPWRPIMGDSLIGVVNDDGTITWPALGPDGSRFEGDVTTRAALVDAALAPVVTEDVATR
jgi:hypothetical protein